MEKTPNIFIREITRNQLNLRVVKKQKSQTGVAATMCLGGVWHARAKVETILGGRGGRWGRIGGSTHAERQEYSLEALIKTCSNKNLDLWNITREHLFDISGIWVLKFAFLMFWFEHLSLWLWLNWSSRLTPWSWSWSWSWLKLRDEAWATHPWQQTDQNSVIKS